MSKPKLVLVDSNALIHRAYHAFPDTLFTKDGQLTNAVYGFSVLLLEVIAKFKPEYLVCAFDLGEKTLRHDKFKDYKATRKPTDKELLEQFPLAHDVVNAFGIPIFELAGYEADDLIGSIAADPDVAKDLEVIVVTGDQDLLQLLAHDHVKVYLAGSSFSASKLYGVPEFTKKYSFKPDQLVDYKAIMGDSSDNIPGVAGVGKKGATDLLGQFQNLEEIYQSLESDEQAEVELWESKPFKRMAKKLAEGKEMAFLSRDLATIIESAPIEFQLQAAEFSGYDVESVRKKFKELEFRSLLKRLPNQGDSAKKAEDNPEVPGKSQDKYELIKNNDQLAMLAKKIATKKLIAFDTETDSLDHLKANLLGLGLAWGDGEAAYIDSELLAQEKGQKFLRDLLAKSNADELTLVAHNLKFDLHMLQNLQASLGSITGSKSITRAKPVNNKPTSSKTVTTNRGFGDTMLLAFLLRAGANVSGLGLKQLAESELDLQLKEYEQLSLDNFVPETAGESEELGLYCCADADATFRLHRKLSAQIESDKRLHKLYTDLELPLVGILVGMEREGVVVDQAELDKLNSEITSAISELERSIFDHVGEEFNIGSPKQVGEVLFEKLEIQKDTNIKPGRTLTGAFSTDERTLRNFSAEVPVVEQILEYRELAKLKSTYVVGLGKLIDPDTKKIHTNYRQAVASTGRLSSTNPNLQNIPISSDLGRQIRRAFSAGPDRQLLALDYAQQELRLLAHLSGEEHLIAAFKEGEDIHALTASKILDLPLAEVSKKERRIGKTVNFGVVYGISAFGLADRLKIDQKQAGQFIEQFFASYPKIKAYFAELRQEATEQGAIYTLAGRKRDASGLKASNYNVRAGVERELINFPLQGGAADIMKQAMLATVKIQQKYPELKLHLQIHDELVFSLPKSISDSNLETIAREIRDSMQSQAKLKVPMLVDVEIGENLYELKPLTFE